MGCDLSNAPFAIITVNQCSATSIIMESTDAQLGLFYFY